MGIAEDVGVNPKKVTEGLESSKVPGRGAGEGTASGARRLGVFGGVGASEVATAAAPEEGGSPGEPRIFFRLSSSGFGLALGSGSGTVGGAASATVREKVARGVDAGGFSGTEAEAASVWSSRTLLNHCRDAFFSRSRSSAVTE